MWPTATILHLLRVVLRYLRQPIPPALYPPPLVRVAHYLVLPNATTVWHLPSVVLAERYLGQPIATISHPQTVAPAQHFPQLAPLLWTPQRWPPLLLAVGATSAPPLLFLLPENHSRGGGRLDVLRRQRWR